MLLLSLGICLLLFSCAKEEKKETDLVTFPLTGRVISVDTTDQRVMIAHDEIPNYMMAMTMPFKVKDRRLLDGVAPGDSVVGTLAVSRTESWLETLQSVAAGEPINTLSADDILLRRLFQIGDRLPDHPLTNQSGRKVRFSDFRDKVVALTFVYTRCPLPDFCIRMSDHFARIQRSLASDPSLRGKWHLVTISFDPKFDTPTVLKSYAETYGADLSSWDFVTDSLSTIMTLTDGFGLSFADDQGLIAHNLRTAILDREGKLVRVIKGNEWTVEDVVDEMRSLMP
jgi:protein SCO1/2